MKTLNKLVKISVLSLFLLLTFSLNTFSQNVETITGKLVTRPDPPISYPYGGPLLYSVRSGDINYITTINGQRAGLEYFGSLFELNDSVKADGYITMKVDFLGENYYEIELESIEKLASAPGIETIKCIVHVSANPAVTYPPLPGMDWAIIVTDSIYWTQENVRYLTENGQWFNPNLPLIIGNNQFTNGDSVVVTGCTKVHYNIRNEPYYTFDIGNGGGIEFLRVKELFGTNITVLPNPNNGIMHINSPYYKVENIGVYTINGKLLQLYNNINQNNYKIDSIKEKGTLLVKIILSNKQVVTKKVVVL